VEAALPRILVAEDETLIRLDLERLLGASGFDVCGIARDGVEAVELALELRPDLIVLDVKMPRLDGVEAARRILAAYPVPIVMLTAYGYGDLISRAVDAGVAGYVVKPFEEQALLDALRTASGQEHDPASLAYLDRAPED
jgi:response regulator NasT